MLISLSRIRNLEGLLSMMPRLLSVVSQNTSHTYTFKFITTILDGYTNASNSRAEFPLSNGLIKLNNSHTEWSGNCI